MPYASDIKKGYALMWTYPQPNKYEDYLTTNFAVFTPFSVSTLII